MKNSALDIKSQSVYRMLTAIGLIALLAGCASTPGADDRTGGDAPYKAVNESGVSADELAAANPVSDEALAAALADDYWDTATVASLNDQGQLVYSTQGEIVNVL